MKDKRKQIQKSLTPKTKPSRAGRQSPTPSKPAHPPAVQAKFHHAYALVGSVYKHQLKSIIGDNETLTSSAVEYVMDLLGDFKARDAVEQMLISQMIQTHTRLTYLNISADQQSNIKWAVMMHEAADRAANTFRRQMLGLAEYRRPPRPAHSFTAIGQANIAQQQLVQNKEFSGNEKATIKQGCQPVAAAGLPAHTPGSARATAIREGQHALDTEYRAPNE